MIDHIGNGPRPVELAADDLREIMEESAKRPENNRVRGIVINVLIGEPGSEEYHTLQFGDVCITEIAWIGHVLVHMAEIRAGMRVCDGCGDFHHGHGGSGEGPETDPDGEKPDGEVPGVAP